MRQVTNIDESTLVEWATSAARTAIDQVQESARLWVGRVTGLLPSLPSLHDLKRLVPGSHEEIETVAIDEVVRPAAKAKAKSKAPAPTTRKRKVAAKARKAGGKAVGNTAVPVKRKAVVTKQRKVDKVASARKKRTKQS
jgi:hypothetical protein